MVNGPGILKAQWRRALDSLLPQRCSLCALPSDCSLPLCDSCKTLLRPNLHCCRQCAAPLPEASAGRLCGACLKKPPPFDRVIAPWLYDDAMAYLVRRWKFEGAVGLTPLLGALWLQNAQATPGIDIVTAAPLHWRRLLRRGYNQSELLLRELLAAGAFAAPPSMQPKLLSRPRSTAPQYGLNASARRRNLRGAFTVRGRCDNLRVAVVDDVFTTGATASAMASALRSAGASAVEIWCLARTPAPVS
ncbi:MAG: ComF family protein [Pseudomonadota bacterium]